MTLAITNFGDKAVDLNLTSTDPALALIGRRRYPRIRHCQWPSVT